MSPFAFGTSQPPTESIVASVAGTARDTGIDLLPLRKVRNVCREMREKYEPLFNAIADRVDSDVLIYQLPGGMISNLVSQLKEQDALDRLDEVFHEVPPRVREDLGYPPLVTPTSQIVGTQAVFNVLMNGERYRNVTNEVKDYVLGLYGRPPAPISPEIRKMIIGDEKPITVRPADQLAPIYEQMKKEATEQGLVNREEDVLTYILYPSIAPSFLRGGERQPEAIPEKRLQHLPGGLRRSPPAPWRWRWTARSSRSGSSPWRGGLGHGSVGRRLVGQGSPRGGRRRRCEEQHAGHGPEVDGRARRRRQEGRHAHRPRGDEDGEPPSPSPP